MPTELTIFIAFVFIVVLGTSIWAFIYWWKKSNYTRERFAFLGAVSLFGLISLFLAQLTTGYSIYYFLDYSIKILLEHLNLQEALNLSKNTIEPTVLTPFNAVIYMLVILAYGHWFFKVFNHWEGKKSIAQFEQERNSEKPNPITDIALILSRNPEKKCLLKQHEPKDDDQPRPLLSEIYEQKSWHIRAKSLWLIHSRHYIFDDNFDLEKRCWWGEDKNTGDIVALICSHDFPNEKLIQTVTDYANEIASAKNKKSIKIIIANKNDILPTEKESIENKIITTSEKELLSKIIDLKDYFDDINYKVNQQKLSESNLTIADIYTPSYLELNNHIPSNEKYRISADDFIEEWLNESSNRHIALLGEYGQGKSTISLMVTFNLIKKLDADENTRIPILIELRGRSPRSLTIEELLASWAHTYHINVAAIIQLLLAGKLLLIFEGFDEMDLTGDTDARLSHFRTLWKFAYPDAKILITGRPNFFLDDSERKRALGIDQTNPQTPFCQAVYLSPFDEDQIKSSLRYVDDQTRSEIYALAKSDKKFLEIVSRPSLLFIVAMLWKKENLSLKISSINSAMIIELFIRHSYHRQGAKQSERSFMALNTAERAYFMQGIAVYMGENNLPNQISLSDLNSVIDKLIDAIPDEISKSVGTTTNEECIPLKSSNRFDWNNRKFDVLEHIKTDVRACGILVSDLSKSGTFKYAHKSFMEFLQAEYLCGLLSSSDIDRIRSKAIKSKIHFSLTNQSIEVMMFLAELISNIAPFKSSQALLVDIIFDTIVVGNLDQSHANKWFRKKMIICSISILKYISYIKPIRIQNFLQRNILSILATGPVIPLAIVLLYLDLEKRPGVTQEIIFGLTYTVAMLAIFFVYGQLLTLKSSAINLGKIRERLYIFIAICKKCKISDNLIQSKIGKTFL